MRNLGYMSGYMQKAGAPAGPPVEPGSYMDSSYYFPQTQIPGYNRGYISDPRRKIRGTYSFDGATDAYFPRAKSVTSSLPDKWSIIRAMEYSNTLERYRDLKKRGSRFDKQKYDELKAQEASTYADLEKLDVKGGWEDESTLLDIHDKIQESSGIRKILLKKKYKKIQNRVMLKKDALDKFHAAEDEVFKYEYRKRDDDLINAGTPKPPEGVPAPDITHSAPVKQEYLDAMDKDLPRFDQLESNTMDTVLNTPEKARWPEPGYGGPKFMDFEVRRKYGKPSLTVPATGRSGLPALFHEYSHAVDPALQQTWHGKPTRSSYWSDPKLPEKPLTDEPEIPAMVTERAAEASPYLPPERRRPFNTPMGKQIEKFGPTLRGNFKGDLGNIRNWMQAMRRVPRAGIQAKKPFAYHGDTRTPQQRAKALGSAYQGWMNSQVPPISKGKAPTKPLMSTTQKSYLPASIRAPDQEAE